MFLNPLSSGLRKLRQNEKGIAAIEFALILPAFALLFFAAVEVSFLMLVDRKVTHTASSLGDLVARGTVMTETEVNDIFSASVALFQPYDGNEAQMRVTSIEREDGQNKVVWSRAQNMTAYSEGQTVTVPNGLLQNGESVVLAEVNYSYNSTLGYFLPSAKTLNEKFYLRPRRVDVVDIMD
ncbi:MAG: pilus assembly protein [Ponticaulis sp.]|nr:pilus assembly protein [Ponticaulis sp.]